mmetsp:Transcript_31510/g.61675  ORF Transcript_31510/g.61675 Transcript_31510/m.61675 type:complete len:239 (+) Transcript_31510:1685-2401(+)
MVLKRASSIGVTLSSTDRSGSSIPSAKFCRNFSPDIFSKTWAALPFFFTFMGSTSSKTKSTTFDSTPEKISGLRRAISARERKEAAQRPSKMSRFEAHSFVTPLSSVLQRGVFAMQRTANLATFGLVVSTNCFSFEHMVLASFVPRSSKLHNERQRNNSIRYASSQSSTRAAISMTTSVNIPGKFKAISCSNPSPAIANFLLFFDTCTATSSTSTGKQSTDTRVAQSLCINLFTKRYD